MSRASEKRTEEVRQLKRREDNKICVNCKEKGPEAVCTTFNTFVCMMCAGIHRGFNHRIKNISTSEFTDEEVKGLREGGNRAAAETYFANYNSSDFTIPDVNEPRVIREKKVREFIQLAYVEQRWMKHDKKPSTGKKKKTTKKKIESEEDDDEEDEDDEEEETSKKSPKEKEKDKKKSTTDNKKKSTVTKKKIQKEESEDEDNEDNDEDEEEEDTKSKKSTKKSNNKTTKSSSKRDKSPEPPVKNLTDVLPDIGKLVIKASAGDDDDDGKKKKKGKKTTKAVKKAEEKHSGKTTVADGKGHASAPSANFLDLSNVLDAASPKSNDEWADFGSSNSSTSTTTSNNNSHREHHPQTHHTPAAPSGGFGEAWANFDVFSSASSSSAPVSHPPASSNSNSSHNVLDLFGSSAQPTQPAASLGGGGFGGFAAFSAPQPQVKAQPQAINFTVQSAHKPEPIATTSSTASSDPFADLLGTSNADSAPAPTLGGPSHSPHTSTAPAFPGAPPAATAMPTSPLQAFPGAPVAAGNPAAMGMGGGAAGGMNFGGLQLPPGMSPQQFMQQQAFMQQQFLLQQQLFLQQQMLMRAQQAGGAGQAGANPLQGLNPQALFAAQAGGAAPVAQQHSSGGIPNFTGIGAGANTSAPSSARGNASNAGFSLF